MNKALYIVGIVFSFVFFCVSAYYVGEVSSARIMEIFSSYDSYGSYSSYGSYNSYSTSASDLTTEAGLIARTVQVKDLPPGIYLYILQIGNQNYSGKFRKSGS